MTCGCRGVGSVLTQIGVLTAVGLVVGAADSWRRPLSAPMTETVRPVGAPGDPATAPASGELGLHITLADAKRLFDEGVPFIDARPDHERSLGTIPGSMHITPGEFSSEATNKQLVFVDPEKPVVIFCTGGDCHDSENLAGLLRDWGCKKIHILTEGYPAWATAGYDTEVPGAPAPQGAGGN